MSQDAISALDAAISKLEMDLAGDPRFSLLTSLRKAREAYGASTSAPEVKPAVDVTLKRGVGETPRLGPGRAQAFQICRQALLGHHEPVKTRTLYELVESKGVNLPGGMNNLSSMLGRHPTVFKSHGRAGWTLKDVGMGAEPTSVANGDSSAQTSNFNQKGGDGHEATMS
jgi:hypothetical protein